MSNIAVIKLGGSQHLVKAGDLLKVNRVAGEEGSSVEKYVVLSTDSDKLMLNDGKVELKLKENKKDKKIRIVKFRAKSRYRRTAGHRQNISIVEVVSINGETAKPVVKSKKTVVKDSDEKPVKTAPKTKITNKAKSVKKQKKS
jgi:large subunit ribosomal protein L21